MEKEQRNIKLNEMWNECLAFIRKVDLLTPEQFGVWFEQIKPVAFDGVRLDVSVPSAYFVEHIELNYKYLLVPALRKIFGDKVQLFYNYNVKADDDSSGVAVKTENQSVNLNGVGNSVKSSPFESKENDTKGDKELESNLNPRYNFENFCVGSSNKLAHSIGSAIATDPQCKTFNPLFIFGLSGVGKTHLLHAIGIGIKEHSPSLKVLYVTSRLFESQFVFAARNGKLDDFLGFYQGIDCLLIDDIQDLIGKEKTQNAFFHIFNHLSLNNRQIILTSDCRPSQMEGLPDRLMTRFKWGMTVELEKPDYELRLSILKQKSLTEGIAIPDNVLEHIARIAAGSIRELEGIMVGLMARATFMGQSITEDLVDALVEHSVSKTNSLPNFDMITQCVSSYYNIEADSLFTKNRKREVSDARQMIMYLAKKHARMKFKSIGTRMARNHSTVMHACASIEARLGFEKQLQRDIEAIEKTLYS